MRSGLFSAEGLAKEPPSGFEKITEGTAAVLFPPANIKSSSGTQREGGPTERHGGEHEASHDWRHHRNKDSNNGEDDDGQAVFYNPAQVVNRDLSVCALACFSHLRRDEPRRKGGTRNGITILEALSATGLRAIRYYKEISGVRFIIANDLDADAVECIRRNCEFNGVPCIQPTLAANFPPDGVRVDEVTGTIEAGGAVIPNLDDANDLMFRLATNPTVYAGCRLCVVTSDTTKHTSTSVNGSGEGIRLEETRPLLQQELMDVVDLDPYGSASPFLDAAMRCIKEGGLLLVTSTDSAILCGNYPDTCHAKYNTIPSKNAACHEMAVRILLAALERVANKQRKYIVPLLSLHIDFYVRCFVRVYTQPAEVKLSPCKLGYMLQCSHCPAYWVRPMAVARMRSKKRVRKENMMPSNDLPKNFCGNDNNNGNNNGIDNNKTSGMEKDVLEGNSDAFGRECFPAAPMRQGNPKITAFNLQHMPSCVDTRCCKVCGAFLTLSGPIYAAPTQCVSFLSQLLHEVEQRGAAKQITAGARVSGLVRLAMEELPDTPLFYQIPDIASFVRVRCPPTPLFVGALGRMGYRCSQVHCAPSGIKTDCPPEVLVRVMLQWKKLQEEASNGVVKDSYEWEKAPASASSVPATTAVKGAQEANSRGRGVSAHVSLLEPLADADFSYDRQFDFRGGVTGVAKFIPNAPNWGPKRRHQGAMHADDGNDDV
ncbi:putative N(2), N(2)-dimethylguanosine tRNA methyltransferase [Trypanosoma rangeli]|uniref:tRNA (guanine(26)-N(2))-dimethyltransferase n=1 Tax=Trypanosoma rangeli TaxID=5698 RepID=A0A3R7KAT5_TRYRA|nr:putative N(2), N(2)-dimethylguanosine tRNA methyltransferase [Trypanosoma rangeli]RNF04506.1 putative N(2), N(2)-dimethylguanosine tRNA methyltransferase [Trypanosoma rangeli]|eukprot:RNF04506.1 putative N(2), N(2)-dimethylguanosine tRNA methyltransferase [Trypanosoma rangeli]